MIEERSFHAGFTEVPDKTGANPGATMGFHKKQNLF